MPVIKGFGEAATTLYIISIKQNRSWNALINGGTTTTCKDVETSGRKTTCLASDRC